MKKQKKRVHPKIKLKCCSNVLMNNDNIWLLSWHGLQMSGPNNRTKWGKVLLHSVWKFRELRNESIDACPTNNLVAINWCRIIVSASLFCFIIPSSGLCHQLVKNAGFNCFFFKLLNENRPFVLVDDLNRKQGKIRTSEDEVYFVYIQCVSKVPPPSYLLN